MAFNSYSYLVFLWIAVFVFWQLKRTWRGPYLLVISLIYYATWNVAFVILPLAVTMLVYVLGRVIISSPDSKKLWKRLGITLLVLFLGFFKYRDFVLGSLNALTAKLGLPAVTTGWTIGLPLGISFYTFECISYLIDTSQGRVGKSRLLNLADFVCFWPHLMAGPIVRVRELIPQFEFEKAFDFRFLVVGLDRFVWGLVQKNMFADSLAQWVDQGFQSGRPISTLDGWFLAAAFGCQIYFDFNGYTNMAIGVAQMMGIKLPENFRYPYHASSPPDFWSRWHMTLTRWIRDYMFFPVTARFRGAALPLYASLLGVMAVVGLWHGAGWGFVVWGILHGIFMVFYRIFENLKEGRWARLAAVKAWAYFWPAFTLVAVTAAWVPFRAHALSQAVAFWKSMFFGFTFSASFAPRFYWVTVLIALFCAIEPYLVSRLKQLDQFFQQQRQTRIAWVMAARLLLYSGGLLLFMIFSQRAVQFIYFQF